MSSAKIVAILSWPQCVKGGRSSGQFLKYRKTSNIRHTLLGNKLVDHSDVV